MAIYFGAEEETQAVLRKRVERAKLRPLYRTVHTDDFDRPEEDIVRDNILVIAAAMLPGYQLSHRSAAVRGLVGDYLFMSGPGKPGRHIDLPGVRIIRLPELTAPEFDRIETPTELITGTEGPPEPLYIRVSTPLQTIFECLSKTRTYPEKSLPDEQIAALIARLSVADRQRAERFAVRNGLRREYLRFQELSFGIAEAETIRLAEPEATEFYFYGWRIGRLVYLGAGEYQFAYDAEWPIALSKQLPLTDGISYEGRRMPAFFENCLPEGWTESVVLASNKIAREDLFGLLSTTRKYLSNLTLRPLGIPEADLVYDAVEIRLDDLPRSESGTILLREAIGEEPADPLLWRRTRHDGPLRLSGVQAKLPVSLAAGDPRPVLRIGSLYQPCTHILKVPAHEHPGLIENEWATMELARRIGLSVAPVAMAEFQPESRYRSRSLLIERYDIPTRAALDRGGFDLRLFLQEDACSLLLLRRDEKYQSSMERIAAALLEAGLSTEVGGDGLWRYLQMVLFSWIVGNGDLHAKNVSVLRRFRLARPGEPPILEHVECTPFYDLVNTRLHVPGDDFALPLDGRRNKIALRHFQRLAARWGTPKAAVSRESESMAVQIRTVIPDVLRESALPLKLRERYQSIVEENLRTLLES